MKTTLEESRGGRRRTTAVVLAVVVIAAVLGYALYGESATAVVSVSSIATVSTSGQPCTDSSLAATAAQVEAAPQFTSLSGGLCYNFVGAGDATNGTSGSSSVYTFDYYNGSIFYPCGTFPEAIVVSQIQAEVLTSGSLLAVQTASLVNDTSTLNSGAACGPNPPALSVVSAQLVEVTIPAVLEVNLTLDARFASQPVTQLSAVMMLPGGNQTVTFSGVTAGMPLSPGQEASQISIITGPAGFAAGGVYEMAIDGQFQGGQPFGYTVQIALVSP